MCRSLFIPTLIPSYHTQDDGDVRLARMRRAAGYEDDGTFNPALLDIDVLLGGAGEEGPEEGPEEGAWLRAFKRRKALVDLAVRPWGWSVLLCARCADMISSMSE